MINSKLSMCNPFYKVYVFVYSVSPYLATIFSRSLRGQLYMDDCYCSFRFWIELDERQPIVYHRLYIELVISIGRISRVFSTDTGQKSKRKRANYLPGISKVNNVNTLTDTPMDSITPRSRIWPRIYQQPSPRVPRLRIFTRCNCAQRLSCIRCTLT